MTHIRKLALALCLVLLFSNYSNSQTVDVTGTTVTDLVTGNLINKNDWTNAPAISGWQETCCTGGPSPILNADTNTIRFSYGWTTVSQSIAVNQALQGTGIQVSGYKWGWTLYNQHENGGGADPLYASVITKDSSGNIVDQMTHNYSYQVKNWERIDGIRMYNSPYQANSLSTINMEFVGEDSGFWAGYYGPRVRDPSLSLLYKTDPCATNPAYSSTCAGFNNILNTNNLLDSTKGGASLNQAFAINTALENAGVGATVHGFNYGFNWRVGTSFSGCTATNQDGSCSWYMNIPAYANASVTLTNNSSKPQLLYSQNYSFAGDGTSGSVSEKFLLPTSLNQTMLGTARISGSASGTGSSIEGAWATMIYTADPCSTNSLYSPDCKGYAAAIVKQISASTTSASDTSSLPPDPANPPPDPANPAPNTVALAPAPGSPPPPGSAPPPEAGGSQPPSPGSAPPPNASAPLPGAPTTSAAPTANNPQPKPGEVQTAGSSKPSNSSSNGPSALAMSVVASVQAKVSATEKATVQKANEAAATATAQAVQMAESVAGTAQANSIASSTSSTTTASSSTTRSTASAQTAVGGFSLQGNTQTSVVSVSALRPYTPTTDTTEASTSSSIETNNLDAFKNNNNSANQMAIVQQPQPFVQPLQAPQQESQQVVQVQQQTQQPLQAPQQVIQTVVQGQQQTQQTLQMPQQEQPQVAVVYQAPATVAQPTVSYSLTEPSNFNFDTSKKQEISPVTEVEVPKTDTFKMGTRSTLNDYMSEQPFMSLMGMEPAQDGMVKRNVQPNEAAGGVDIASIATQPKGYDAYAQMTLKDASFYKVEDIYKGQRNVDNARLLRGLQRGSDTLHQNMVDQQYKLGK